ncbi:MAG: hypothetical protein GF355_08840 [Candidatus Eisenbacteria bacterium]|nr:hypothetical protein [Candidatus Eisenbacteria bacterium]
MSRLLTCLFLSLIAAAASAQLPPDDFLPGWERAGRRLEFKGQGLYDHVNGGAEIFHELGFDELFVQTYAKDGAEIDLELYRMTSPAAALGIYLMKSGRETPAAELPARNTANRFQLSLVKGAAFVQINSFSGDEALMPVMAELARQTLAEIPAGEPVTLLETLPSKDLIDGSQRLVRGPFTLQAIYTLGDGDILQLKGEVFGVAGRYRIDEEPTFSRIIVPYPSEADAEDAFENVVAKLDPESTIIERNDRAFIFEDYRGRYGLVELEDNRLDVTADLIGKPELPQ